MNLSNVILIIAAIILLWGAINLDRTSQRRVIEDQSSQLNDSMEILNRLKGKSPEEKSKSRRVDEYSKIVNKAVEENPEHIEQIEANFVAGTSSNNANLESLLNSTNQISANLEENGFKLSHYEANRFNNRKAFLSKHPETKRIFTREDRKWKAGDIFYQKDLAETLKRITENGRDGFYKGKTAELIVKEMEKVGGWISINDLKNYSSIYRNPIYGNFNEYKIISMGPPSSGGILLVLMLNMIDEIIKVNGYDLSGLKFNSKEYVHLITEVERRAYADRATHLGDEDFWEVPTAMLLSKEYAAKRVGDIDINNASLSKDIKAGSFSTKESEETTHYSVVDKDGNAVSVTTTINSGYGSGITVTGAGFILNNEMDDFSSKPGVPNMFGLLGNEANAIEPAKRPLSSMTPTIVLKNEKPFLVLGTPGGSTIITTVLQNFLNVALHQMSIKKAIDAPRFHSQWMPDIIDYEKNSLSKKVLTNLKQMGHDLNQRGSIGEANGIMIDNLGFWGGADRRGENSAIGY